MLDDRRCSIPVTKKKKKKKKKKKRCYLYPCGAVKRLHFVSCIMQMIKVADYRYCASYAM